MNERKKEQVGRSESAKGPAGVGAGHEHNENCRCKETAQMTPRQLLNRMFSDLAFWKKGTKS